MDIELHSARRFFEVPLSLQRYIAVEEEIAAHPHLRSVVDFGCSGCALIRRLKQRLPHLEWIVGVDVDESELRVRTHVIQPLLTEYVYRRPTPLYMALFAGSLADYDERISGAAVVTLVEVIEHLEKPVLEGLVPNVFGRLQPQLVIVTTPNAEFNVLFLDFKGKRHADHKFEWTRREFEDWCLSICKTYPLYHVTFRGIGQGPPDTGISIGCCSQAAIFSRTAPTLLGGTSNNTSCSNGVSLLQPLSSDRHQEPPSSAALMPNEDFTAGTRCGFSSDPNAVGGHPQPTCSSVKAMLRTSEDSQASREISCGNDSVPETLQENSLVSISQGDEVCVGHAEPPERPYCLIAECHFPVEDCRRPALEKLKDEVRYQLRSISRSRRAYADDCFECQYCVEEPNSGASSPRSSLDSDWVGTDCSTDCDRDDCFQLRPIEDACHAPDASESWDVPDYGASSQCDNCACGSQAMLVAPARTNDRQQIPLDGFESDVTTKPQGMLAGGCSNDSQHSAPGCMLDHSMSNVSSETTSLSDFGSDQGDLAVDNNLFYGDDTHSLAVSGVDEDGASLGAVPDCKGTSASSAASRSTWPFLQACETSSLSAIQGTYDCSNCAIHISVSCLMQCHRVWQLSDGNTSLVIEAVEGLGHRLIDQQKVVAYNSRL